MLDQAILNKKAELVLAGAILIDRGTLIPFPLSRSTAGPEVGSRTLILEFSGTRVKLRVTRDLKETEFRLFKRTDLIASQEKDRESPDKNDYLIMKGLEDFLDHVKPVRTPIHAPRQAFINIDANCRFHCLFCSSPELEGYTRISNDRWISHIRKFAESGEIDAIALTSGVPSGIEENIDDFVYILERVRDLGLPMGVEPYVETRAQLQRLYDAGARELKLNIEAWDKDLFRLVCPDLDHDSILRMLKHGVEIFGQNNVTSNIIIGLGESDACILEGLETLARMGVAANLRRLHLNPVNRKRLETALDIQPLSLDRYLELRDKQEEIFHRHGIDSSRFHTMCFPCKGCDLDL